MSEAVPASDFGATNRSLVSRAQTSCSSRRRDLDVASLGSTQASLWDARPPTGMRVSPDGKYELEYPGKQIRGRQRAAGECGIFHSSDPNEYRTRISFVPAKLTDTTYLSAQRRMHNTQALRGATPDPTGAAGRMAAAARKSKQGGRADSRMGPRDTETDKNKKATDNAAGKKGGDPSSGKAFFNNLFVDNPNAGSDKWRGMGGGRGDTFVDRDRRFCGSHRGA